MNAVSEFAIGSYYSNDQIRFSLRVENLGGVRPSINDSGNLRHIAIMTSTYKGKSSNIDNPYHDRIEGDVLVYTASGRKGDQLLSGRNKRVLEQYANPIPIFGFINHGQQLYEFLGLLELIRHYTEQQVDRSGVLRVVWVFEFQIHRNPTTVSIELAEQLVATVLHLPKSSRENSLNSEREVVITESKTNSINSQNQLKIEELRSHLLEMNPYKFEHLIKVVLEKKGFINVDVTRSSSDGGIDLNAVAGSSIDFFEGTHIQIQAKRWRHAVGSVEINNFRGAMNSVAKGIFITTSHYTRGAIENAYHPMKSVVTLIDGQLFSSFMLQTAVSISNNSEII